MAIAHTNANPTIPSRQTQTGTWYSRKNQRTRLTGSYVTSMDIPGKHGALTILTYPMPVQTKRWGNPSKRKYKAKRMELPQW